MKKLTYILVIAIIGIFGLSKCTSSTQENQEHDEHAEETHSQGHDDNEEEEKSEYLVHLKPEQLRVMDIKIGAFKMMNLTTFLTHFATARNTYRHDAGKLDDFVSRWAYKYYNDIIVLKTFLKGGI